MVFADLNDLLHMQGHGFYVWLAYGATLLTLVALVSSPLLAYRRQLRGIARQMRRDAQAGEQTEVNGEE